MLVPSYVDAMNKGQGGHQRHNSGAMGVTAVYTGPYGGGGRPQERYGTAPARDDRWGEPKRRPRKRWRDEEAYRDRGKRRA